VWGPAWGRGTELLTPSPDVPGRMNAQKWSQGLGQCSAELRGDFVLGRSQC
jgi:hypothetical protein